MIRIVIDEDIPFVRGVFEPYAQVVYLKGREISRADVQEASALIVRTRTRCDAGLLGGTKVRIIASATIGSDHIDTSFCRDAGIRVAVASGSNARGVLQWMAAALAAASLSQGWEPYQKTLGIIGVGHVGSLVAHYARSWGFRVICCDPPRKRSEGAGSPAAKFISANAIACEADIITFHTPLARDGRDATYHMAGADFFRTAKPGAMIINTSRGEVLDEQILAPRVADGTFTCCIDTWEGEPEINRSLLADALLGTPHIAGYSAQGKANAAAMSIRAVAKEFGFPLEDWYPPEVARVDAAPITWAELKKTIGAYFDIAALSGELKASPQDFEKMRDGYTYRQEYF